MKLFKMAMAAGLMLASVSALAYTPGAGIAGTKHDWSAAVTGGGTGGGTSLLQWTTLPGGSVITTYNTGNVYIDPVTGVQGVTRVQIGLCTKCHTPHQAKSTNLLWNHTLSTANYSWDVPFTTAGTNYATFKGDTYKGPTTKCLSCHDGSIASTDGMWFNRQSVAGAKYVAPAGTLNSGHEVASTTGGMAGTHPVAMPYPFMNAGGSYNFSTIGADAALDEWVADPKALGIRLFKDDSTGNITAGTSPGKTGIECSSCHDVHNGSRVKDALLVTGLLTGSSTAAGGYICTQCHKK